MTQAGPLRRVTKVLEDASYVQVSQPTEVGGIPFEFAAMLAGKSSLDLVILVNSEVETDFEQTRRRVEGLTRALDLVRSRRSLTVVFVGPPPDPKLIRAIATVARVLRVRTGDEADIRTGIAVLLPLKILEEEADGEESWPVSRQAMAEAMSEEAKSVMAAAKTGSTAVEAAVGRVLGEPLASAAEPELEGS
jgi:hypothetical protein